MNEIKIKLISIAIRKYQKIFPCGNKTNISDCFTQNGNSLLFWFNTEDQSTHILKENTNTIPVETLSGYTI